jgi:hypothetical protein
MSMEVQRLQPGRDLARCDIGLLQQFAHGEEAVELAGKYPRRDGHAGVLEPRGIFVAFVAQGIGARRQHIGRRQSGERFGERRRGAPVLSVGQAIEIMVAKPPDHGVGEQDAGLGLAMRGMLHRKVGGGIDQHLAGDFGPVAVARGKRDHGCEIAAGTVAADHQPRGVDAELLCVGRNPFGRRNRVVDRGGKFMLGGEAVIDRYHDQLAFVGEFAAHHVVGIEVADHPAAAVKEHQAGREPIRLPQF